jgi:hypothetical protein
VFVHQAQPAGLLPAAQAQPLTGVQLPGLMRGSRPRPARGRAAAGRRRLEAGTPQVPLEGPGAGPGPVLLLGQDDADVGGAPGRVLPAQVEGRLAGPGRAPAAGVARRRGASGGGGLPLEAAHGARRQPQPPGDLGRGQSSAGEFADVAAQGSGDGAGHGAPGGRVHSGGEQKNVWV